MKGYHVERRFGWDTHGVPIEHEIDKKLNIKSKEDVAKMGIANYNAECRAIVMRCATEWQETMDRLGRWVDFENDYKVGCVAETKGHAKICRPWISIS
jgi:isoleucyl-tRNA synthetase